MGSRAALRIASVFALAMVALASVGCEKDGDPSDTNADKTPPRSLLAVIELPSGTALPQVAAFAKTINPRLGAMATTVIPSQIASAIGDSVQATDGVDLDGPLFALVVDPELATPPIVLVVGKKGAIKPKAGLVTKPVSAHMVAIGTAKAVAAIDNYAAYLVTEKVTTAQVVAFPEHLLTVFADKISALREMLKAMPQSMGVGNIVDQELTFFEAVAKDWERVTVRVAGSAQDPHIRLDITAKASSRTAKWFAEQTPAAFSLMDKLPPSPADPMFIGGTLHGKGVADAALKMLKPMFAQADSDFDAEALAKAFSQLIDQATGEFATVMRFHRAAGRPVMDAAAAYGIRDVAGTRKSLDTMLSLYSGGQMVVMGMRTENKVEPHAFEHAGVAVTRQISKTEAPAGGSSLLPPGPITQESFFAVVDDALIFTMDGTEGAHAETNIRAAIDHAKSGGPGYVPTAAVSTAIAQAKKDKASLVMTMDLAAMGAPVPPMAMSLIFSKRSATLTFRFVR